MAGGCPASSSETVKGPDMATQCWDSRLGMEEITVLGFTDWYGDSHGSGIHGLVWRQSRYWDSRLGMEAVTVLGFMAWYGRGQHLEVR